MSSSSPAALAADALLAALALVFGALLDAGLLVGPRPVDVSASDARLSRAPVADAAALAPPRTVALVAALLPPLLVLALDAGARATTAARTGRRLAGYALGAALVLLGAGALRAAAGSAGPTFLSACAPPAALARVTDAAAQCAGGAPPLAARASFPSTPAALAVYAALVAALYVRAHAPLAPRGAAAALLQAGVVVGGAAAAAAQVGDARAHGADALAGAALGAAAAALVQARFFGGLARSAEGGDAAELREFLLAAAARGGAPGNAGAEAAAAAAADAAAALPLALRTSAHFARLAGAAGGVAAAAAPKAAAAAAAAAPPLPPPAPSLPPPPRAAADSPPARANPLFAASPAAIRARMAAVHARALGGADAGLDVLALDPRLREARE